jgi:hypothetical protein
MIPTTKYIGRNLPARQDRDTPTRQKLALPLRCAVAVTAAIDLTIGLAFLLGRSWASHSGRARSRQS